MIKILAIFGSPRRNGNTDRLLEAFLEGPVSTSIACRRVRVSEMEFTPCTGCRMCEKKGHCVVPDGMQVVYEWIDDADLVVLASTVYFYGLTAQAKALAGDVGPQIPPGCDKRKGKSRLFDFHGRIEGSAVVRVR